MKKLIIIATIAVSAVIANAASLDWSFTEQSYDSNNPLALDSFTAYLFTEADWTAAMTAGITASTFDSASDSASLTKTTGGTSKPYTKWATNAPETWTDEAAASGNYYIVLYDGSKYTASSAIAATAYDSAQQAHTAAGWQIKASATPLSSGDFTAVPEPTSGLLMLLGFAGLALRRRYA